MPGKQSAPSMPRRIKSRRLNSLLSQVDRGAWMRFFVAMAGLAVAFAAALFSTVFREAGNVFGVVVSASIALLTAGFVGIYTVPYLAKRVALERVKDAFDYDVTSGGLIYLGIATIICVAALNTGNNLLFIILAAMLAAIIVSGAASAILLRGLSLEVSLPMHVFARQPIAARLSLRNRFPIAAFSVSVTAKKPASRKRWEWQSAVFSYPPNRPPEQQWVHWRDLKLHRLAEKPASDPVFSGSVYFPFISPRRAANADVVLDFARRGRYVQESFAISTRFPFAFLVKTRHIRAANEVIVYPPVSATEELERLLPMISGEFETFIRGRGYDLYRIRDYTPGDPARHVDWKASARSTGLKVREFTQEDEPKVSILFDNPAPGALPEAQYEQAVALAASLAWHFFEAEAQVVYQSPAAVPSGDIYEILHQLALIAPGAADQFLAGLPPSGDFRIILTTQPRGSLSTQLWSSSYVIYMQELGQGPA